ncbi:selenide, water dikinase SelD [Companilactobacillus versmoldensis]|uniref:Selenide, water dikinase n=1 Tax=Companilactobacillus versmoldensis DSM 14857 = KCTC 3814 TaxID=1423815 RepID=A0A0R1SCN2_9LACO|nr:selenide, water dikinase SelD [Companilactobacillus versmoldensis]KRL66302.1 selenide, water dikinase [Companilactobacillus versmoldensis DSM 14857 = KCTC 3814]
MDTTEKLIVCGGCNAKLGPGKLENILKDLHQKEKPDVMVDFETTDDAAIIKVNDDTAIIQTIDFFTSMVSDPYLFGKIAATNALSDIWAMGGSVVSALNVVCFPQEMNQDILKKILQGGLEKVNEAGGFLAGGHSIQDQRPKYGLSVNGIVDPKKIWKNDTCQLGDDLILTKPLGVGIITSAYGVDAVGEDAFDNAVDSMTTLNKYAADIIRDYPISACTDVTGFGLLGHLNEFLDDKYTAVLDSTNIPILPSAYECAGDLLTTGGGERNREFLKGKIDFTFDDIGLEEVLFDPQTSGGLLFSIDPKYTNDVLNKLNTLDLRSSCIGHVVEKEDQEIIVK